MRFELGENGLKLYTSTGEKFVDYVALSEQKEESVQQAEQEHQRAERLAEQLQAPGIELES